MKMENSIRAASRPAPFDPIQRGYSASYHANEVNHCPGCGRTHWIIGTTTAECGFCATALPLIAEQRTGAPAMIWRRGNGSMAAARGRFTINGRA